MLREFIAPDALCPKCGYHFDRASNMMGAGRPQEGDLTLCLSCGGINMFDKDLKPVAAPEGAVDELTPSRRKALLAVQKAIIERGPIKAKGLFE